MRVVTIGSSAGGIPVLLNLVQNLPANLDASIFVVQHTAPMSVSTLPDLLSARGKMPAVHPLHLDPVEKGRVYVAPPDNQMLLRPGVIEVLRGPRENGHRPSVDALFRTAAASYGPAVIGLVLSGYQTCGTAGMLSIKARGGLCIAQRPDNAEVPEMPQSAIDHAAPDHVVASEEMPGLLADLLSRPPPSPRNPDLLVQQMEGTAVAPASDMVCPVCQGVLTEVTLKHLTHFRCHTGHAFTLPNILQEQNESVERALWASARALEESASLNERIAEHHRGQMRARFVEKVTTLNKQAALIRQILVRDYNAIPTEQE